jgi:hypothetical protein
MNITKYLYDLLVELWSKLSEWREWIIENLEWCVLQFMDFIIGVAFHASNVFFDILPPFDFPEGFDAAVEVVFEYVPLINKFFPVPEFFALCAAYLTLYFGAALPFRWLARWIPGFGVKR